MEKAVDSWAEKYYSVKGCKEDDPRGPTPDGGKNWFYNFSLEKWVKWDTLASAKVQPVDLSSEFAPDVAGEIQSSWFLVKHMTERTKKSIVSHIERIKNARA